MEEAHSLVSPLPIDTKEENIMNTYESIDGKRFVLRQDPYLDGTTDTRGYFTATAICPDDIPDENWMIPVYRVVWEILPEWDGEDGSAACNWDEIADYYMIDQLDYQEIAKIS